MRVSWRHHPCRLDSSVMQNVKIMFYNTQLHDQHKSALSSHIKHITNITDTKNKEASFWCKWVKQLSVCIFYWNPDDCNWLSPASEDICMSDSAFPFVCQKVMLMHPLMPISLA